MPFLQNSDGAYSHNWRSKMGTVQNIFIKHCNLLILRTLLVIFSTLFYKVYFTQSFYFGVMRILITTIVSQKRIKCLLQLNMKQHHHQMSYPLSEKKHWTKYVSSKNIIKYFVLIYFCHYLTSVLHIQCIVQYFQIILVTKLVLYYTMSVLYV